MSGRCCCRVCNGRPPCRRGSEQAEKSEIVAKSFDEIREPREGEPAQRDTGLAASDLVFDAHEKTLQRRFPPQTIIDGIGVAKHLARPKRRAARFVHGMAVGRDLRQGPGKELCATASDGKNMGKMGHQFLQRPCRPDWPWPVHPKRSGAPLAVILTQCAEERKEGRRKGDPGDQPATEAS